MNSGDYLNSCDTIELIIRELSSAAETLGDNVFLIGKMNLVSEDGHVISTRSCSSNFSSMIDAMDYSVPHPATFIPRGVMSENLYDETYSIAADFKFLVESLYVKGYKTAFSSVIISNYDMTGISSVRLSESMNERMRAFLEVLPKSVAEDYRLVLPVWRDRYRLRWFFTHRCFYTAVRFLISLGMRMQKRK